MLFRITPSPVGAAAALIGSIRVCQQHHKSSIRIKGVREEIEELREGPGLNVCIRIGGD